MKLQIQCAWGALLRGALIGLALTLVSACSTTPAYPPAPATLAGVDYNYHIGPLDTVNIIVWRNPELSMTRAGAARRQDHDAAGRRPARAAARRRPQLARDIEKALGKYIRDPVVTVIVTEFVGPANEQIRVIGEAAKPQVLAVSQGHDGARRDDRGGRPDRFRRRQRRRASSASPTAASSTACGCAIFVKRGDITANVDMRPGDILIIPQSWF